jgi:fermentation-respiration switch protein FrsA (DUF1100 family)
MRQKGDTMVPGTGSRGRRRRMLAWVAGVVLGALLLWWGGAWFLQRSVLFPRDLARPRPDAKRRVEGLVERWIDTPEGRVESWLVPAAGASAERPAPAVVFFHGNAETIDDQVPLAGAYARLGVIVLLPEYRGYGRSAGSPSEEAIVGDAARFLDDLLARPDVDRARVVFHGRSVGCGVALALARRRAPAALVLESPFRSVAAMAIRVGVPPFLVRDPFDNEAALEALDVPALLFHGRCDRVVPYEHSVALAAVAKRATLVTYDCDHNDLPPDEEAHWDRIASFLSEHGVLRP